MTITARQLLALHLYYATGCTYRKIGTVLSIDGKTAYDLVQRGRRSLYIHVSHDHPHKSLLVEALLRPSPTASVTCNVGLAASRQGELLDALEFRLEQRAEELAHLEECMSGDSYLPTHCKRNTWDQWELNYICSHKSCSPSYEAKSLTKYAQRPWWST